MDQPNPAVSTTSSKEKMEILAECEKIRATRNHLSERSLLVLPSPSSVSAALPVSVSSLEVPALVPARLRNLSRPSTSSRPSTLPGPPPLP